MSRFIIIESEHGTAAVDPASVVAMSYGQDGRGGVGVWLKLQGGHSVYAADTTVEGMVGRVEGCL